VISGTGSLEVCFVDFTNCNTNNWSKIPQNGIYRLNQPSVHLNVKWNGTGNYVFENEWQSFRGKKGLEELEFKSSEREIISGKTKVAVKVVDIFGNDTMKVMEVEV